MRSVFFILSAMYMLVVVIAALACTPLLVCEKRKRVFRDIIEVYEWAYHDLLKDLFERRTV